MTKPSVVPAVGRSTRVVLAGGLASGIAAYGFTILGARVLGETAYAPVGVLWTLQYLVLTVGLLSPEAFVTREGRVPRAVLTWVGMMIAGLGVSAWLARSRLFGDTSAVWPLAVVGIGVAFSSLIVARGLSANRRRFGEYAALTGGESVARLILASLLMAITPSAIALGLVLPAGAACMSAWWLLRRRARPLAPANHPSVAAPATPPDGTRRFLASTTTANAVAQILLAGGPLLTASLGAAPELTSQVFVTTTAARAPLVLVYSGLLARLLGLATVMPRAQLARHARFSIVAAVTSTTLAGAVGALIGPELVALAFGAGLRPSAAFAALTAAAVVLTIWLLAANQVLIALRVAHRLIAPWVTGLAAASVWVALSSAPPDLLAGQATLLGLTVAGVVLAPRLLTATRAPL